MLQEQQDTNRGLLVLRVIAGYFLCTPVVFLYLIYTNQMGVQDPAFSYLDAVFWMSVFTTVAGPVLYRKMLRRNPGESQRAGIPLSKAIFATILSLVLAEAGSVGGFIYYIFGGSLQTAQYLFAGSIVAMLFCFPRSSMLST